MTEVKKLYKSTSDKQLAGVLGGIGEYLNVDATLVRVLYILFTTMTALVPGVLAYIVLAVIIPSANGGK